MNLIPRDSFFDNAFDSFFSPTLRRNTNEAFAPRVDIKETEGNYEIHADLPGVKKEDMHITLEDGVLSLEASTASENTEKDGDKIIKQERYSGRYVRSFSIGKNIKESDINATFNDGVLSLSLPKVTPEPPAKQRIEIK